MKYLLGKDAKPSYPTINSNENLAENFAQFFKSEIQKLYQQLFENTKSKCTDLNNSVSPTIEMTNFVPVSEESVKTIILNMHNKTCSLDVIPTWMLKKVVNSFIPILHFIINLSLSESHVPSCLKHSIITPVLKKSNLNTNEYKSFRPVSNLSFVSKLIKKCVYFQIQSYLKYCIIIFFVNSNLLTILVTAVKQPLPAFTMIYSGDCYDCKQHQSNLHNSLMLLDLSAAFDILNHNQLLFVIRNTYGLNHKVLEWLHSYLDSRTFSVIAAGSQSQVHNLDVGVPQGSILGPLLFILFTKDLQDVITVHNMHFHFYADDTQVFLNFQPTRSEFMHQNCLVKLQNCLSDKMFECIIIFSN